MLKLRGRGARIAAPGRVELAEVDLPDLGPRDVLVRVRAAAICGSDLHLYRGRHPDVPLPSAAGHEVAGEVEAVGREVTAVRVGDRVCVEPVIPCGRCGPCLEGHYNRCLDIAYGYRVGRPGLADWYVAEDRWVHLLPENLSFEEGALVEPAAVAFHILRSLGVGLADRLVVFGAGPVGLLCLQAAAAAGVRRVWVVDIRRDRLGLARELVREVRLVDAGGSDPVAAVLADTDGQGVSCSIEAVGLGRTLEQALGVLAKGGRAAVAGIFEVPTVQLDAALIVKRELRLLGCSGYCHDFPVALDMAGAGRLALGALVSHRFPLSRVADAFAAAADPGERAVKVIVVPD